MDVTPYPVCRLLWAPLLLAGAVCAHAQEFTGTLGKIAQTRTIVVGYHESTSPFTYSVDEGKPLGYSYDFALKIADAIKRELKLPALNVKPMAFTTQNRFPMVQNKIIDIICGATTHTRERENLVTFSNTIFVAGAKLMTRKDSGIKDYSDLTGRTVVTFAASTSEKMLRKMNDERNMRINIVSTFDRNSSPFLVLQAGHADAYMMDDVLLFNAVHQTWKPDDWVVTGTPPSFEAYACFMQRGDNAFKKVVDQEITRIMKSGEAKAIYQKWLMSPIPPKSVNYAFPMSAAMVDLFDRPNDQPFY
ncbi:transporter substrate-binding domain-containing protein [Candidatus Symbiobacter mobilis]|uniref:Glutamate/aspartate transporter substrate-binding protein n=1 Tax=Candidatus Symbiobacter mobilis CR TaxID=946483 RepID=U5N7G5_9BURK|nr:transporter substrate-binding domain-containing protein [Candidatus Symbiobacter mobilis]AGX86233.1 glutamate/aspartate transporter substrate-binding protein [Candidatus Symbiobacter mobilis CR]